MLEPELVEDLPSEMKYEMSRIATLKYRHDMIDEEELETEETCWEEAEEER